MCFSVRLERVSEQVWLHLLNSDSFEESNCEQCSSAQLWDIGGIVLKTLNLSWTDQKWTELESMNPRGRSANLWTSGCVLYLQNFTDENLMPSFPFQFIKIKWYHSARVKNALKRTNRPACFYCLGRGGGGGRGEPCFSFFFFFPLYKNNRRKAAAVISGNWRHFLRFYIKLVVFFPLHTQWTPVRSRREKNRTNCASKPTNLPT